MTPASPESVRVRAPGKINVFLEVGDVHDDGYHELATAFQAVSLYEEIVATPADDITLEVAARGPVDVDGVPTDGRNLAVRAARLLAQTAGIDRGVHLAVRKGRPRRRRNGRRVGRRRGGTGGLRCALGTRDAVE